MSHRPHKIEQVPEDAVGDLQWAYDAVREGRIEQIAILAEFNRRMGARGLPAASKSGFNRWALAVRDGARTRPRAGAAPMTGAGDARPLILRASTRVLLIQALTALLADVAAGGE